MIIAVTGKKPEMDAEVDPRFGRCRYFCLYNTETEEMETIDNENAEQMGGVGILGGELMSRKGVKALLTGNVGPNAFDTLKAAGIDVYTGFKGTVKDAVEKFKAGDLNPRSSASVESHHGD